MELRWISALNNLIDLNHRETSRPDNEIHVSLGEADSAARLLVYKNRFLINVTEITNHSISANPVGLEINPTLLDQINQKIAAIHLKDNTTFKVTIDRNCHGMIGVNRQNRLELSGKTKDEHTTLTISRHPDSANYVKQHQRINLLKSNQFFIQELKKQIKNFAKVASVLMACIIMLLLSLGYDIYTEEQKHKKLEERLNQSIRKYLPKTTSATNAVLILRDKVNTLKNQKEIEKKYLNRQYKISRLLNELSLLKPNITSIKLSRLSLNDQSIRIQGHINSYSDFDQIKEGITRIFPANDYQITFNQKSKGTETIQYSVTVLKKN